MPTFVIILWLFALGACVGSFLNVVIYRLPLQMSIISPPSRCPHCETPLKWTDNIPVVGWIILRGKCKYCGKPISPRYPIVETITGLLFSFYYYMFFVKGVGVADDYPLYFLDMALISGLLAVSVIDAEHYTIPAGIPWFLACAAVIVHTIFDRPDVKGAQLIPAPFMALSAGAGIGLAISIFLLQRKILPLSFPEGDLLEHEREKLERETGDELPPEMSPAQIRAEMRKEMLFLIPPMMLAGISLGLYDAAPAIYNLWTQAQSTIWLSAALGSLIGGLAAAFMVWLFRIVFSYIFGKEAMGLGDVHLMFGVGAVLGFGPAGVAFFIAPFIAISAALYLLFTRSQRQSPYGPHLSLATAIIMLCYDQIYPNLHSALLGMVFVAHQLLGK
jgi:leader peptidase (prepilin peptidase)/N-methyltransferase